MGTSAELAYRIGAAARHPGSWLQLLKFGLVGLSGYVVNLAVFALLVGPLGVHHLLAAVLAFCVAVTNNFLWNRYWTFEPGEAHPAFQAARFFVVSIAALLINLVVLEALLGATALAELPAQAIAVAVAMPFNFLGNKLWTFADSPSPRGTSGQ
jgi:dolichol-phosphate mannosyltransferase